MSDPVGPERPLKSGYRTTRSHGRAAYEIEASADLGHVMASGRTLPILKDGKARAQVGALTDFQDGRALVRFSRSEKGRKAETLFASGAAQMSISYLRSKQGQDRPVALSMRSNTGASTMEPEAQEIARLGAKYDLKTQATDAIAGGTSLEDFRAEVMSKISNKPIPDFAYHDGENQQYSLGAAIRGQITGKLDGIEAEVHQELSRSMPSAPRGVVVPNLLLHQRTTMNSSNVASLVESMPRGDLFVDNLLPMSAVLGAGATILSGLSKAISIPKETAELSASFVAEGAAISESNLTIGSITMTPRRISGTASFTLESLVQSNPQIDNLIRQSLTRQISQALDSAALQGNESAPNPTGVVNTSGVNALATAGNTTMLYREALQALKKLDKDNARSGKAAFIINLTNFSKIASTAVDAGSGGFVVENGQIVGRRVVQSILATAGTDVLGDFRQCIVSMFGGTNIVVDSVTQARSATVLVTQHQMADIAIRHPEGFWSCNKFIKRKLDSNTWQSHASI